MSEPRIRTRCPSCGNDTLVIDDARNLVCSLIGCERPTMIGEAAGDIARLKAELERAQLHAWGPDAPAPESITYAECEVDGVRIVRLYRGDVDAATIKGAKATLTRFVRAEAAKDADALAAAVQAERLRLRKILVEVAVPVEALHMQPRGSYCREVEESIALASRLIRAEIVSDPPPVDVLAVVREYIDARANCDWRTDTVKRYAAASDALRALVAPRTSGVEDAPTKGEEATR